MQLLKIETTTHGYVGMVQNAMCHILVANPSLGGTTSRNG
jgi:hypothetical protein